MDNVIVSEEAISAELVRLAGSNPNECYQCGKCASACPLSPNMDFPPKVIMRLLQVGKVSLALSSKAIWLCTGCKACSIHCPRAIDLPKIVDGLKILAVQYGYGNGEQAAFHRNFLNSLRSNGRVYGPNFRRDLKLGLPMLLKGKLKILPSKVKNQKQIRHIFATTLQVREDGVHE
ncbi:MAG TPA: 4Fe-4S dicluster domain-containing protein [Candidatus Deferrimicrobium sp.]|nr:4Fe-4S dicluster domain-containing protein [Candidatus Deferrimicrobium sp.]